MKTTRFELSSPLLESASTPSIEQELAATADSVDPFSIRENENANGELRRRPSTSTIYSKFSEAARHGQTNNIYTIELLTSPWVKKAKSDGPVDGKDADGARFSSSSARSRSETLFHNLEDIAKSKSQETNRKHSSTATDASGASSEPTPSPLPPRKQNVFMRWFWFIPRAFGMMQNWVAHFACAALCGLIATYVNNGAEYFADLKIGVCQPWFWLSSSFCCMNVPLDECTSWYTWAEIFGMESTTFSYRVVNFFVYLGIALLFAVFSGYLVREYSRFAVGAGIAEVRAILGGMSYPGFLGGWTLMIKSLGMILASSSGLSIGKLGPFVHISACIGNLTCRFFPKYAGNEVKRREVIFGAVATAMAVAFGAPIGGVLFSLEVMCYKFQSRMLWRSFFNAVVASVILQWTTLGTNGHGKYLIVQMRFSRTWCWFELLPLVFLGGFCGYIGHLFNSWNLYCVKLRKTVKLFGKYEVKNFPLVDIFVWTVITTLIQYPTPFLREPMARVIGILYTACPLLSGDNFEHLCRLDHVWETVGWLFLAGTLKFLLMSLTFSLRLPAGNFAPSLMCGACFGRLVGTIMRSSYIKHMNSPFFAECGGDPECVNGGFYALVGSIAMLGGISRMTISLVVIIVEVAAGFEYIFPLMLSIIVSNLVADSLNHLTLYDRYIELNEYPFIDTQRKYYVEGSVKNVLAFVSDAMKSGSMTSGPSLAEVPPMTVVTVSGSAPMTIPSVVCLYAEGQSVGSLLQVLSTTIFGGFPVVRSAACKTLVGFVVRNNLVDALVTVFRASKDEVSLSTTCVFLREAPTHYEEYVDLSSCVGQDFSTVSLSTPLWYLTEVFKGVGMRKVIVVNGNGEVIGVVTRRDMVSYLRKFSSKRGDRKYYPIPGEDGFASAGPRLIRVVRPDTVL